MLGQIITSKIPYHVTTGGEAAIILQSNLAICPSVTVHVLGLRTNRGIASRRSGKYRESFDSVIQQSC